MFLQKYYLNNLKSFRYFILFKINYFTIQNILEVLTYFFLTKIF